MNAEHLQLRISKATVVVGLTVYPEHFSLFSPILKNNQLCLYWSWETSVLLFV